MSFGCPGGQRIRPLLFHNSSRVLLVRERQVAATITELSPARGVNPSTFHTVQKRHTQPILKKTLKSQPEGKKLYTAA